ncbi:MAG: GNAT family N-acetyltransferase [Clostridia bacterium]|nr:GNAT family N-acetyltransferase [Clostridia bacterium]
MHHRRAIRFDSRTATEQYVNSYPIEHLFETPHLHALNEALMGKGQKICFMAEYFLPDVNVLTARDAGPYKIKLLYPKDFAGLYLPEWSNALCADRKHLDVLGVGAYDGDMLIGLAGCSADCDSMWQIGIDVLPAYRRQGIASALTSRLAIEILNRGKVPFYCAAWSNVKSVRNAIRSGFRPAWGEMTAKPTEFVDGMNQK